MVEESARFGEITFFMLCVEWTDPVSHTPDNVTNRGASFKVRPTGAFRPTHFAPLRIIDRPTLPKFSFDVLVHSLLNIKRLSPQHRNYSHTLVPC